MKICMLLVVMLLQSCAYYSLQGVAPDGTQFKGRAIVANDSEQVTLEVQGTDYLMRFGKTGTDGEIEEVAKAAADVATEILNVRGILP